MLQWEKVLIYPMDLSFIGEESRFTFCNYQDDNYILLFLIPLFSIQFEFHFVEKTYKIQNY
jgi:hypothetical protein